MTTRPVYGIYRGTAKSSALLTVIKLQNSSFSVPFLKNIFKPPLSQLSINPPFFFLQQSCMSSILGGSWSSALSRSIMIWLSRSDPSVNLRRGKSQHPPSHLFALILSLSIILCCKAWVTPPRLQALKRAEAEEKEKEPLVP